MGNAQKLTSLEQHGSTESERSCNCFSEGFLFDLYAIEQSAYVHHNLSKTVAGEGEDHSIS